MRKTDKYNNTDDDNNTMKVMMTMLKQAINRFNSEKSL